MKKAMVEVGLFLLQNQLVFAFVVEPLFALTFAVLVVEPSLDHNLYFLPEKKPMSKFEANNCMKITKTCFTAPPSI